MSSYWQGQLVRLETTVTDLDGNLVDPTTLTLKYGQSGGIPTVLTWAGGQIIRDSLGMFHADVPAVAQITPQQIDYEFIATGAATAAGAGRFTVKKLPF